MKLRRKGKSSQNANDGDPAASGEHRSGSKGQGEEASGIAVEVIPSEQDRKAMMGCLAAALNLMRSYEAADDGDSDQGSNDVAEGPDAASGVSPSGEVSMGHGSEEATADEISGAPPGVSMGTALAGSGDGTLRGGNEGDNIGVSSSHHGKKSRADVAQRRHHDRWNSFQQDLIHSSNALLRLDEGCAEVYASMLDFPLVEVGDKGEVDDDGSARAVQMMVPFLQSFSSKKAAFTCVSMLLFQFLLSSGGGGGDGNQKRKKDKGQKNELRSDIVGYDARVRSVFKVLAVAVLSHHLEGMDSASEEKHSADSTEPRDEVFTGTTAGQGQPGVSAENAKVSSETERGRSPKLEKPPAFATTRKFEALEDAIATKLCTLAAKADKDRIAHGSREKTSKQKIIRGLKIGTAGVAAGTLFAVTGGMAAPAIAAGIATVAGGTAIATAAALVLSSSVAVMTIFGVGGGGLVAYKMKKRTDGLTEFEIKRETPEVDDGEEGQQPELSRTVCVSGWLRDKHDFQRPWGVTPGDLTDKLELLQRFFSVHNPSMVSQCARLQNEWEGKYDELWEVLRTRYDGRDPDTLLPLHGPRQLAALDDEEDCALDDLIEGLGFPRPTASGAQSGDTSGDNAVLPPSATKTDVAPPDLLDMTPKETSGIDFPAAAKQSLPEQSDALQLLSLDPPIPSGTEHSEPKTAVSSAAKLSAIQAWDFHAEYGGELYTVRWESELLLQISNSVRDLAVEMAGSATKEALKKTTMAALLSAVVWPAALLKVANMIDGNWTLLIERADEAGVELARCLLESTAGHRPVSLVGFSFGARVIYKCLKELAWHQERWEEQRQKGKQKKGKTQQTTASSSTQDEALLPETTKKSSWMKKRSGSGKKLHQNDPEANHDDSPSTVDDAEDLDTSEKSSAHQHDAVKYAREPASIVEDAILMGCPASSKRSTWAACRRMVAGRFVNCYHSDDLMLQLMFRYKNMTAALQQTSGTAPVRIAGVENYNVSDYVEWHSDYCVATRDILSVLGYDEPKHVQSTGTDVSALERTLVDSKEDSTVEQGKSTEDSTVDGFLL